MNVKLCISYLGLFISMCTGSVTVSVPSAGNCGDDTVLTCHYTSGSGSTGWYAFDRTLLLNGKPIRPEDNNKYTETKGTSSFTLTIHNTDITDEGMYACTYGFSESETKESLKFECKASAAILTVPNSKKVVITVDKLYPASPTLAVSFIKENSDVTVPGSKTCYRSTQYTGYYRCVWTSSNSLADETYRYNLVVTTITQADLTGTFKIVSPQTPILSNVNEGEDRLYANEGQAVTIQCISRGGYPTPTVALYKDTISSSTKLASISTGTLQSDHTYSVTLQHTFTPSVSDDRKPLICRSYYPQADSAYIDSKNKSVVLYLNIKPSHPTVTQTSVVSPGDTVEVTCRTTGCRPAANISWSYQGSKTTGVVSSTPDAATETFTVVSVFRRKVTAADNGQSVHCIVTHPALINPSKKTAALNLNVRFPVGASSTKILGNKEMIATGSAALTLTCTTGSSNPASDITWKNGSALLTSNRPYINSTGENNGVVRSQQLVLYPTRYMDGDVITCTVSNEVSQSDVLDDTTLNLKYHPIINSMNDVTVVEGNTKVLTCTASSKPASTFTWYKEGQSSSLKEGTGTLENNKLSYTINNVRRTDAAIYNCDADNDIETADSKNVNLTVYFPPVVTVDASNTTIKETSTILSCNADGLPNKNYQYGKWIHTWPGYLTPLSQNTGNKKLELTGLTYEHSGVYTCSASNGIKVFGTNKEFIEGSVYLLVKSFPIVTRFDEKIPAKLDENAKMEVYFYSNAGSDVKIEIKRNGSKTHSLKYFVSTTPEQVDLKVFTHNIKTDGIRAQILIHLQSKEDLGHYNVVVSNEIDFSARSFEIILKEPPSKPYDVRLNRIESHKAQLSWIRGYHGGYAQTFVIQLSTDKNQWVNVTIDGGMSENTVPVIHILSGLQDSTTYYVRMYAYNMEGESQFTDILNLTTPTITVKEITQSKDSSTCLIIGVVLGAVIVGVVSYAIYVTVLLKRKQINVKEGISRQASGQTYVNLTVSSKGKEDPKKKKDEKNIDGSENLYTDLDKKQSQESTYDAISSM